MKNERLIRDHIAECRKIIDDLATDRITNRLAFAMEEALRWVVVETSWGATAARVKINADGLKRELGEEQSKTTPAYKVGDPVIIRATCGSANVVAIVTKGAGEYSYQIVYWRNNERMSCFVTDWEIMPRKEADG